MIETYKATEQCKICKGNCCKHMACHYAPSDFKDLPFEGLKAEIEKGKISIDWWEIFEGPEYYLRARHIGEPVVDPSYGGICVNLTETGCSLSWEERPLGAKALKPRENESEECYTSYGKRRCKNDWKPYSHILKELVEYFEEYPLPPNMGMPGMMEIVRREEQEQKTKEYKKFWEEYKCQIDERAGNAYLEGYGKTLSEAIREGDLHFVFREAEEEKQPPKIFVCGNSIRFIYPEDEEEKQNSGLLEE